MCSLLQESKVPVFQTMFRMMRDTAPSPFVGSPKEGWNRVIRERGKYAFLLESSSNNYFNQRIPCKTMKVGRNLDSKGYGIVLHKKSNYRYYTIILILNIYFTYMLKYPYFRRHLVSYAVTYLF